MAENIIAENIAAIKKDIPENVTLVGVTKHRSVEETQAVVDAGVMILEKIRFRNFWPRWTRL